MQTRSHSLLFKIGSLFGIFAVIATIICGLAAYATQSRIYQKQQEQSIRNIADYMTVVLSVDGPDFPRYQAYMIEHHDSLNIPADFTADDVQVAR